MTERPQLSIVSYRKGMYIILEDNRDAERFFIIQKGTVQLTKNGVLVQIDSNGTLGPGDFFGVVSSMAQKSQIETAQAMTDVSLIATSRSQFNGLIQFNTPIAMKIIQQFSRRMRYLNNELARFALNSNTNDDAATLFAVAEYYLKQKKYKIAVYAYKRYTKCYPHGFDIANATKKVTVLAQYDKPGFKTGNTPFVRYYMSETPVFVEGESGDELFIIQSGSVKITKIINKAEVILTILKPGDIFGEMALLESKPRSASAIPFENTTLMVVQKQNFEGMTATQPQVIARLTQLLAERIWFGYKQIANAQIKDPVGRCIDYLLLHLERNNILVQQRSAYTFNFGPEDLTKMASVQETEMRQVIRGILQNGKLMVLGDGKLHISDVSELAKLSDYHKKARGRERK